MTEAAPKAEKADKIAATKAAEAHLKVEEQKASAKAVKDVQDAATMTAPPPNADEVEKTAAIKTADACLKAAEQEVLLVKDAEEAAEAARKAEEEKAEKSAVIRAEEVRLKAEADERAAAEEAGVAMRETHNSAAKAKEAAAAKEAAKRQADKEKTGAVTRSAARATAKAKAKAAEEEAARKAQEAERARREEQSSAAKRKAAEAKEAAKTQELAELAASEAEAEALAKAIQDVDAIGAAMKGKEYWLINAEARSEILRGRDLSDLDSYPWKIEIEVTVNGCIRDSCNTGTLLVVTSSLWLIGSKGSMTIQEFHQFNAQDLGQWHNAPTKEDDEDQYKLYSNEHGTEAHKSHIEKDALLDAWRAEEDLKLCEQMQKEWESSGPTPPDDPGGAGRSGHDAAKAKAGEDSEAGEAEAVEKNKEGAAPTNKFKLAHFQQLRPRSGAYSGFQDLQCEPLVSRPMAVD